MASSQPPIETPKPSGHWARVTPNFTVFVSSMCMMVVELVAGRLIARHVGSSLYTWTSVIGIVLGGIAVGNYLGGLIADRYKARDALASLFLVASATCLLIPLLNDRVGAWATLHGLEWGLRIAVHVFLVFFLPSALLGAISPVAAKMAVEIGRRLGRAVGGVYSWGAIGSIVGTFLTGYFLIAQWGTVSVLLGVSAILLAMAMFYGSQSVLPFAWAGVLASSLVAAVGPWAWARTAGERLGFRDYTDEFVYFDEESNYSSIRVEEALDMPGVRSMTLDFLIHAYISMDDPDNLQYDYERIYAGVTRAALRNDAPERKPRALFLGGGGFVYPAWFLRHFPAGYAEVAEIDPAVTRAAFEAFGLEPDLRMRIFNLDARNHMDDLLLRLDAGELDDEFDLVFGDAFNHYSPPFHLTTLEFDRKVRRLLSDRGVFLANVIDLYSSGRFLGAMINTIERVFPHVYVFSTSLGGPSDEDARDTFVVVGSTFLLDLSEFTFERYGGDLLTPAHLDTLRRRSRGLVLTDDYAPVDNLLSPVVKTAEM